jgi:hypothetical protein
MVLLQPLKFVLLWLRVGNNEFSLGGFVWLDSGCSSNPFHRFLLWDNALFHTSLSPTSSGSDGRLLGWHFKTVFLAAMWSEGQEATVRFTHGVPLEIDREMRR